MMDFAFNVPTKVFFGKDQIKVLGEQILPFGRKILLVYGKTSIKMNGIYASVVKILQDSGIEFLELGGVDPNPRISTVKEGARICKENDLKLVLAVGGGSTIDCAKAIAFAALYDGDPWEFWLGKVDILQALPVGSVLTLAATGSEMNWGSVITNEKTEDKRGKGNVHLLPKFSILNPEYTYTVPPYHTAAGVVDTMAHIFEFYFSPVTTAFLQDSFAESILKTCIKYGPVAIEDPENYEARANLMWASSMALNGVVSKGKTFEGTLHGTEHIISGFYDLTHGVGLAILILSWMEYVLDDETLPQFVRYTRNVWDVHGMGDIETAHKGIERTREFFKALNIPISFSAVGIGNERFGEIVKRTFPNGTGGLFKKLDSQDLLNILEKSI